MNPLDVDWDELRKTHDAALVASAKELFSAGGAFETSAEGLAAESSRSASDAEKLLLQLCPPLERINIHTCPRCEVDLNDEELLSEVCPNCNREFADNGGIVEGHRFVLNRRRSRDVVWVLALHGMYTRGPWQEEFNWRVSTAYGRSVPTAIYKYGFVRLGAFWRPSLRRLTNEVVKKIAKLQGDASEGGFASPPDVVAHSLGTWLIGHALQRYPTLRIGRLILTGSILRPDFDWNRLLESGQVEAVLNHYGDKDFWAGIAQFAIPDSGPSGRRGFDKGIDVTQVCAQGFRHSDFFREENLPTVFERTWRPFLTRQMSIEIAAAAQPTDWHPPPWVLRATLLPLIGLGAVWTIAIVLACSCLFGLYDGFRWLLDK